MIRSWIVRVIGLLLAGGLAYLVVPFLVGGSKMQSFCEAIKAGESKEEVLTRADERGYSRREPDDGRLLLIDSRAMGRFICDVSISDSKVTGAAYIHND